MTDDSQSPSGKVQFIESHQPALEAGDYTITVTQQINIPKDVNHPDPVDETFKLKQEIQSFSVLGPRFTLDPQEIQAVFPPPGSLGEHSNVLPHIILKRSTLPWERPANGERDIPWLALLLFDEQEFSNLKIGDTEKKELLEKITRPQVKKLSEINQDGTVRFPPLLKKADPKPTNSPYWEMEFGDHADDTVTVIDVPADLLRAILPSKEELRLLTHVRQTADVNNNPQGDEVAVIICNRLPQKNGMSFVHLVSLEGRYGGNDFYYQGAKERDLIRLVSLYSRRFACVSEKHSFKGLLMHLNHQLLFNVGATNNRSELNKKNIPPEIRDAFEQSGHPEGASAKVTDCGQWKIFTGNTYYVISDRLNVYNFAGRFLFKLAPNAISPDSFKKPSDVPQQPINDSFSNNKYSLGKDAVITAVQDHWWITTDQQDNQYIISQEKDTLYVHHLDLDSSSTLRLPRLISSDEKANELAEPYFAMGCVPLPHEMRQGNKSVSWYHGPLVPGEIPPIPLCSRSIC